MSGLKSQFVEVVNDDKINITAQGLSKTLKQAIIDGDLSGSSTGTADTLLSQTASGVSLSNFTSNGMTISSDPDTLIRGPKVFQLIHLPTATVAFKEIIPLTPKFRGDNLRIGLDIRSTAADVNLSIKIKDETNGVDLTNGYSSLSTGAGVTLSNATLTSGSATVSLVATELAKLKIGMSVTGTGIQTGTVIKSINIASSNMVLSKTASTSGAVLLKYSIQFSSRKFLYVTVPENCASLSYEVLGSAEAGSPESYIDDIVIEVNTVVDGFNKTFKKYASTDWVDGGPIAIIGTGGNPSKGSTSIDKMWFRRQGGSMQVRYELAQNSLGTTGSGQYLFPIPDSKQVDTTRIGLMGPGNAVALSSPVNVAESLGTFHGRLSDNVNFTDQYVGVFYPHSPTHLGVMFSFIRDSSANNTSGGGTLGSGLGSLNYVSVIYSGIVTIPILGWTDTVDETIQVGPVALSKIPDTTLEMSGQPVYATASTSCIVNFPNLTRVEGDAIKFVRDTVNGNYYEILRDGVYHMSLSADMTTSSQGVGFSKNADAYLNIDVYNLPRDLLIVAAYDGGSAFIATAAASPLLKVGDKIRVHGTTSKLATASGHDKLIISYRGSYEAINVNKNNKVKLPVHTIDCAGISSNASFKRSITTITSNIGSGWSMVNGTLRAEKSGLAMITYSDQFNSARHMSIAKNQPDSQDTTYGAFNSPYNLAAATTTQANYGANVVGFEMVQAGDVIKFLADTASGNPTGANPPMSIVTAVLIETEVSIALNNIQPTWSESDSFIQLYTTSQSYGSTATTAVRFTSTEQIIGTDMTYEASATAGDGVRIKTTGMYTAAAYTDIVQANASGAIYIGVNGNLITIDGNYTPTGYGNNYATISTPLYLQAGDLVQVFVTSGTSVGRACRFLIGKTGKPNINSLDLTSFVQGQDNLVDTIIHSAAGNTLIDRTNEARFATGNFTFTNRGVLSIEDDPTNTRTKFTALKPCTVSVDFAASVSTLGWSVSILKNGVVVMVGNTVPNAQWGGFVSADVELLVGEYITVGVFGDSIASNTDPARLNILATTKRDVVVASSSDKIGEVIWSPRATAPFGYIAAANKSIGSTTSTADFKGDSYRLLYDLLWNMAGLSITAGDPFRISAAKGTTAQLDWDANKTITIDFQTNELFVRQGGTSRSVGSLQGDAIRNIVGQVHVTGNGAVPSFMQASTNRTGAFNGSTTNNPSNRDAFTASGSANSSYTSGISFDASRTVPTDAENRPKNVALNAYIRYTAETQIIDSSRPRINKISKAYDSTSRMFSTTFSLGPVFPVISASAKSKLKVFYHMPCRNDNTGWGGGYIELQYAINGGSWVSLGSCGYDAGVMGNGIPMIGAYNNTLYIDPAQASDYTIQFRFYLAAYSGTLELNSGNSINTISGTAPLSTDANNVNQHWAHMIVEEYVNL